MGSGLLFAMKHLVQTKLTVLANSLAIQDTSLIVVITIHLGNGISSMRPYTVQNIWRPKLSQPDQRWAFAGNLLQLHQKLPCPGHCIRKFVDTVQGKPQILKTFVPRMFCNVFIQHWYYMIIIQKCFGFLNNHDKTLKQAHHTVQLPYHDNINRILLSKTSKLLLCI